MAIKVENVEYVGTLKSYSIYLSWILFDVLLVRFSSWFQVADLIKNCPTFYETGLEHDWWIMVSININLYSTCLLNLSLLYSFPFTYCFRVSCDRALMRQPALRLGLIIYWAVLHSMIATFVIWVSKTTGQCCTSSPSPPEYKKKEKKKLNHWNIKIVIILQNLWRTLAITPSKLSEPLCLFTA